MARCACAVSDNGVGFDPQAPRRAGFGLQSMRERMAALGGRLDDRRASTGQRDQPDACTRQ